MMRLRSGQVLASAATVGNSRSPETTLRAAAWMALPALPSVRPPDLRLGGAKWSASQPRTSGGSK